MNYSTYDIIRTATTDGLQNINFDISRCGEARRSGTVLWLIFFFFLFTGHKSYRPLIDLHIFL